LIAEDFSFFRDGKLAPHALKGQKLLAQGNALGCTELYTYAL